LNGRQFANLAVTIPGVGLGFHSDPTKSTQYSPQINGGNGRNLNYKSDGGVMNIVTKSGTNAMQGSFFELFRDKSMNALTETEKLAGEDAGVDPVKGDYRRNQFGGSFGGPIVRDKAHFFFAAERTQQDT